MSHEYIRVERCEWDGQAIEGDGRLCSEECEQAMKAWRKGRK